LIILITVPVIPIELRCKQARYDAVAYACCLHVFIVNYLYLVNYLLDF
jgi:hypothetical protein